jgi:phosphate transport system substrate-binding protein
MKMKTFSTVIGGLALSLASSGPAVAQVEVDPNLPAYEKVSGISGSLNSIGSDTLNNLMTLWAEGFKKVYPNVNVQIEGKGSSTAPPALIEATAQLGPMSRTMKSSEMDKFEKKYGYKATPLRTSLDSLTVFVNKDNPLQGMSLDQVDALFSKTLRCGAAKEASVWGDLGLDSGWTTAPISLYGRNSASGTYGFFKETALCKGDYKDTVKEQPGSASVVQGVSEDKNAAGYSGIGYATSGVRALPLAKRDTNYVEPTQENVASGKYPLSRFLYIYINKAPGKPVDPLVREFAKYIFSKEGQEVVVKDGYYPVSAQIAIGERSKLE